MVSFWEQLEHDFGSLCGQGWGGGVVLGIQVVSSLLSGPQTAAISYDYLTSLRSVPYGSEEYLQLRSKVREQWDPLWLGGSSANRILVGTWRWAEGRIVVKPGALGPLADWGLGRKEGRTTFPFVLR